jgi:hypothetical protein
LADGLIGFRAGPVINEQEHAGEALDEEEKQRNAAPVIPERLAVDGDCFVAREGG